MSFKCSKKDLLTCLKAGLQRKKGGDREIFCPRVHAPNGFNGPGWDRLKLGANMGGRGQEHGLSPTAFPGTQAGSQTGGGAART